MQAVEAMIAAHPGPFADLVRAVPRASPTVIEAMPVGGVAKMVIGEARNFPELARSGTTSWSAHALGALAGAVAAAQARGEVRPGDPRIYALQHLARC
jgi:hypothetical protein